MAELSEDRGARIAESVSIPQGASPPWTREQILQGALYFVIGAFPSVIEKLYSKDELNGRYLIALLLSSIVAGAIALKAFLSNSKPNPPDVNPPPSRAVLPNPANNHELPPVWQPQT